jgi:hypothetical protein
MTAPTFADVLDWWTGSLSASENERVEEALFADETVYDQAAWVAELARSVSQAAHDGAIGVACLTRTLSERLEGSGLPHTAYVAHPGDEVSCAATADQRFSVLHLKADFRGAERVDVHVRGPHVGEFVVDDVPVDWDGNEVTLLQSGTRVRALPTTTVTFELRGTRGGANVVFGTYVLDHRSLGG